MQDKELDRLFRNKLEDVEVEPSAQVWPDITRRMDSGKRKPVIAWLSIAASVIVLLSAGLYFMQRDDVAATKPNKLVAQKNEHPTKSNNMPQAAKVAPSIAPVTASNIEPVKLIAKIKVKAKGGHRPKESQIPPATAQQTQPEEQLARLSPRREVLKAVVPDIETPLSIKTDIKDDMAFVTTATTPNVLPAQLPQSSKAMAAAPVRKHRIRSFGDMLNVVIGKLDKRKDKLIEFTNTDGDESTITGINLGIIKIKKQE
ncbi:hypothetical protein FFF34_017315 [Inquilinus sp. KBS0705]|nr:hypothetical protein FFF34_017315 [Inquilinus sp. KBS0705]